MGVPIEDPILCGNCPACFDPGETPRYLWACVMEMKVGALWVPTDPPPPNGLYALDNNCVGCWWGHHDANFTWDYIAGAPILGLSIQFKDDLDPCFIDAVPPICRWSFTNTIVNPAGQHYYSGCALVAFVPFGSSPSYFELAQLLNIPITPTLKGDHWPANGDGDFRFVDKPENTNILIQRDFS